MILHRALSFPQPSMRAHSSNSLGIVSKYDLSIHVQRGKANVEWASTSPVYVLMSPNLLKVINRGISKSAQGNIWEESNASSKKYDLYSGIGKKNTQRELRWQDIQQSS